MARRTRTERSNSLIWPGFVDAMTALLMVLMFVLSIFMVLQYVLEEEITGKDRSLQELAGRLRLLSEELSVSRERAADAESEAQSLSDLLAEERMRAVELQETLALKENQGQALADELTARLAELSALTEERDAAQSRIDAATQLAAALRDERDAARAALADAELGEDVAAENAALRESIAEVRRRLAEAVGLDPEEGALSLEEQVAALELLMDKRRREAEETLTLLAAAEARVAELTEEQRAAAEAMSEQERLQAFARATLGAQVELEDRSRLAVALLNSQVRALRNEIASLRLSLGESEAEGAQQQVEIDRLGEQLNRALAARVNELQRYRSEFFGRLREVLGDRDDVRVVGDRFVFQSEVLFASGSADLGPEGQAELARFAGVLREVAAEIPEEVNWILRIDGHTDRVPLGPSSEYASNWELSQARALSVVTYLVEQQNFPPNRLAATGFGEFQPIDRGRDAAALARNRRIELKLTER